MAASENKTKLKSVWEYPQQNPETYRNEPINLLFKSVDWFLHNPNLY